MSRDQTKRRIRGSAWVGAGAITLIVGLFVAARGRAAEVLLEAGDTVFSYEHALHHERGDEVRVNGLGFRVASGATRDGLGAVLDRFEAVCSAENTDVRAQLESLGRSRSGVTRAVAGRIRFDGTLRAEQGGRGAVACLTRGAGMGPKGLVSRLRAFLETGDVEEIGAIRLFFATAQATTTTYVALLSEGSLPLVRAFPVRGDAPGRDPSGLPRPEGAERRLSAWAPGTTASVYVYEARGRTPALALSNYRAALSEVGWTVSASSDQKEHLLARFRSRAVLASVSPAAEDVALVTIVTL